MVKRLLHTQSNSFYYTIRVWSDGLVVRVVANVARAKVLKIPESV
jgi:hypothetical protein